MEMMITIYLWGALIAIFGAVAFSIYTGFRVQPIRIFQWTATGILWPIFFLFAVLCVVIAVGLGIRSRGMMQQKC